MSESWSTVRKWLNRDDGKVFRADNYVLNRPEVVGYSLVLGAMLLFLLATQLGLNIKVYAWTSLILGAIVGAIGAALQGRDHKEE